MGKIYCIMGKSSSGKDTIYKKLLEDKEINLKQIVSYTTRPIREGEVDGVEYNFCTREEKEAMLQAGKIIEIRSYDTVHGVWDYFTADDGQIGEDDCALIGTLVTYEKLQEHFSKEQVIPIYINVEDGIRLQRALSREMQEAKPKYEEMCRRFLADSEDFSPSKLDAAGINVIFQNDDIERTVAEIKDYIRSMNS